MAAVAAALARRARVARRPRRPSAPLPGSHCVRGAGRGGVRDALGALPGPGEHRPLRRAGRDLPGLRHRRGPRGGCSPRGSACRSGGSSWPLPGCSRSCSWPPAAAASTSGSSPDAGRARTAGRSCSSGRDEAAVELLELVHDQPELGYRVVGFVGPRFETNDEFPVTWVSDYPGLADSGRAAGGQRGDRRRERPGQPGVARRAVRAGRGGGARPGVDRSAGSRPPPPPGVDRRVRAGAVPRAAQQHVVGTSREAGDGRRDRGRRAADRVAGAGDRGRSRSSSTTVARSSSGRSGSGVAGDRSGS